MILFTVVSCFYGILYLILNNNNMINHFQRKLLIRSKYFEWALWHFHDFVILLHLAATKDKFTYTHGM